MSKAETYIDNGVDPLPEDGSILTIRNLRQIRTRVDGQWRTVIDSGKILEKPENAGNPGDALILNAAGYLEFASASEQAGTSYTHTQSTPASEWTIIHGLGYNPSVTVVDSAGTTVIGDVTYVSADTIKINFTGGFSGRAYLS